MPVTGFALGRLVRLDLLGRHSTHFAAGLQDMFYTCLTGRGGGGQHVLDI